MPRTTHETEVVITAVDRTGRTFDNIIDKVGRVSALLGNLGFAKDTLNRIAEAFTRISAEAIKANREIKNALDGANISLSQFQELGSTNEGLAMLVDTFSELKDINTDFAFAIDQSAIDDIRDYDDSSRALNTAWHALGTTINTVVLPILTTVKNIFTDILNLTNTALQKVLDFLGLNQELNFDFATGSDALRDQLDLQTRTLDILESENSQLLLRQRILRSTQESTFYGSNDVENLNEVSRQLSNQNGAIETQREIVDQIQQRLNVSLALEERSAEIAREKAEDFQKQLDAAERLARQQERVDARRRSAVTGAIPAAGFTDEDREFGVQDQLELIGNFDLSGPNEALVMLQSNLGSVSTGLRGVTDLMSAFGANAAREGSRTFEIFKALHVAIAAVSVASAAAQVAADFTSGASVFTKIANIGVMLTQGAALVNAIRGTTIGNPQTPSVTGGGGNTGGGNTDGGVVPNIGDITNTGSQQRLIVNLQGRRGYDAEDIEEILTAINDFDTGTQINVNRVGI